MEDILESNRYLDSILKVVIVVVVGRKSDLVDIQVVLYKGYVSIAIASQAP